MSNQARFEELEASAFFPDGRSARPLVEGVVPQTQMQDSGAFYFEGDEVLDPLLAEGTVENLAFRTGKSPEGELLETIPVSITLATLERGRERYAIYCSPCHGLDGYGQGMIVQRGFSPPQSFHTTQLRQASPGYYFDVITNGFGRMFSYAYRVEPVDRWAIVAYIRALQLSQNASLEDAPAEEQQRLEAEP